MYHEGLKMTSEIEIKDAEEEVEWKDPALNGIFYEPRILLEVSHFKDAYLLHVQFVDQNHINQNLVEVNSIQVCQDFKTPEQALAHGRKIAKLFFAEVIEEIELELEADTPKMTESVDIECDNVLNENIKDKIRELLCSNISELKCIVYDAQGRGYDAVIQKSGDEETQVQLRPQLN